MLLSSMLSHVKNKTSIIILIIISEQHACTATSTEFKPGYRTGFWATDWATDSTTEQVGLQGYRTDWNKLGYTEQVICWAMYVHALSQELQ